MNWRLYLLFVPSLIACGMSRPNEKQGKYQLDIWFWHDHLSTKDGLYVQDYDLPGYRDQIPVHFSLADFEYLDSIATSVGFWSLTDSAPPGWRQTIQPDPGKYSFYFKTPFDEKTFEPQGRLSEDASHRILIFQEAIQKALARQPYFNTLRRKAVRE